MNSQDARRLKAQRKANILRLMREIELQIVQLRAAIELKETPYGDPTIEHWLSLIHEKFKNLL
jgi:hypothetical protein